MEKIKLTKDVFLSSVLDDGENLELFLAVKLFGNWTLSIQTFDRNLTTCKTFKNFCKTIGISQKRMTNIINQNL